VSNVCSDGHCNQAKKISTLFEIVDYVNMCGWQWLVYW